VVSPSSSGALLSPASPGCRKAGQVIAIHADSSHADDPYPRRLRSPVTGATEGIRRVSDINSPPFTPAPCRGFSLPADAVPGLSSQCCSDSAQRGLVSRASQARMLLGARLSDLRIIYGETAGAACAFGGRPASGMLSGGRSGQCTPRSLAGRPCAGYRQAAGPDLCLFPGAPSSGVLLYHSR
jgi:hypothetical protein